jgi:phospho-N-acetylmuramoyl-pentapeptide-transferase
MIVAFVVSMIAAPFVIKALRRLKLGQTIQKDGPESHVSKAGTPTMGGVIIVAGMLLGLVVAGFAAMRADPYLFPDVHIANLVALLLLVIGYATIGLVDDYLTIRPIKGVRGIASKPKAAIQVLLAVGFIYWLRQTGFAPALYVADTHIHLGEVYWVLAVLFIVGMANFVNITDGLDGLVSGLVVVAVVSFVLSIGIWGGIEPPEHMLSAAASDNGNAIVPLILAAAGACLAFLWFNTNPARVFMGDTGSLALGALLPAAAVLMHKEILMIIIGLVFILDGFSTIIQWAVFKYTRITTGTGRRVFLKSPVHHHFELMGWPEQTVVVRFWICGIVAAMLGFMGMALGWW